MHWNVLVCMYDEPISLMEQETIMYHPVYCQSRAISVIELGWAVQGGCTQMNSQHVSGPLKVVQRRQRPSLSFLPPSIFRLALTPTNYDK
jgi:hypothetical protein